MACAQYVDPDASNDWVYVLLGEAGNCFQSYTLNCNYDASVPNPSTGQLDFAIGKSAGVCVEDGQFFIADTSDLFQPFSDAFVTFHITKDGFEGSNVLPYLPQEFFDGDKKAWHRFHQIWFSHKNPYTCYIDEQECALCCNYRQNYHHLIGSSEKTADAGITSYLSDISYNFIKSCEGQVEWYCGQIGCSAEDNARYKGRYIRYVSAHEGAHEFNVNSNISLCPGMHCTNNAWCGGIGGSCMSSCEGGMVEWCLMNVNSNPPVTAICQRVDGIDKLDCRELSANSGCPEQNDCSGPNQISVRTDYDPE